MSPFMPVRAPAYRMATPVIHWAPSVPVEGCLSLSPATFAPRMPVMRHSRAPAKAIRALARQLAPSRASACRTASLKAR